MRVKIKRQNDEVYFEGVNQEGNIVHIDGSPDIGGAGKGARPTELLLFGIAGCSGIDVVLILKRMRQELKDLQIEVEGGRNEEEVAAVFRTIHLHFKLTGELKADKVERAIDLSLEKYCTVAKMLEKTAKITYTYTINEDA
ncbi:MAG: OsmC family protein [Bacteroidota bacterium]